jgi:hypothetical protein
MACENLILGDMVDDHGLVRLPGLVADRGLDLQFAAGLQAEIDIVAHRAANPTLVGDAGDRSEPHPGGTAHDFQNARHGVDTLHGGDVIREIGIHPLAWLSQPTLADQIEVCRYGTNPLTGLWLLRRGFVSGHARANGFFQASAIGLADGQDWPRSAMG